MNVLSLFNGMSTLQTAMDNVGIRVDKYYSSEIKKHAISFTQHKYPNTIQLGDVTKWKEWDIEWSEIDFIGSGSPCQDLSIAGKRKGLKGDRSSLFYTFVDILNHVKSLNPNILFLQENVGSAPQDDVRLMSDALGVLPVRINSNLVTAQNRDRYYWTNIKTREDWTGYVWCDIPQPKDRGIMLKDIICSGEVEKDKSNCLLERHAKSFASYKNPLSDNAQKFYKGREEFGTLTCVREYVTKDKSSAIMERYGANQLSDNYSERTQNYLQKRLDAGSFITMVHQDVFRVKEATEQGFVDVEKGQSVDLAYPTSKTRRGRLMDDKSNALLRTNEYYYNEGSYLRLFNQTELERLQGFPDGWTSSLSYKHASSLLGDGWTLPIIEHILKFIEK